MAYNIYKKNCSCYFAFGSSLDCFVRRITVVSVTNLEILFENFIVLNAFALDYKMNTIYEDAVFHPHSLRNLETPNSLCASESESSEDQTKIENTENAKEDNITTKQGDEQDIIDRSDTNSSSSAFKTNGIFRPVKSPNFLPLKKENGENGHVTSQNSLVIDPTQLRPHKVILVGNSGVGKSSLMMRLCDNVWSDTVQQSIGVDFR